ncbi:MAG: 50S ribosomal protein L35 [Candidatus Eisenbacteria bacterium]|uniref:Large ribosomal subunit protein bL35 n=1 Tax=Eiseniibacteriota bacterium TaxID=2212470 RepID=A0A948W5T6_UNCEI|nr:50S ribosomal protein L35 [Candidatus Eisenbacteria bacterium]MBU1949622.1 50S ribosomal protein L35 [Candidatus Eisenbacteria bacterium]MBU2690370.1 50S ribosomal protein L35 [Candidatus Eisenbacteria bacterium]
MPKMKTRRGAAKRFKVTGSGKIVRHCAKSSHLMTCKTRKAKRRLRHSSIVDKSNARHIRILIGPGL